MTESEKKESTETQHLFENKFAFVSEERELKLKKNSIFEERTLLTVDPDSLAEQVEALEKAFESLEAKAEHFLSIIKETEVFDAEKAESELDKLLGEISEFDAIGDFEALVKKVKDGFLELKESKEEKGKKAEEENTAADGVESDSPVPAAEKPAEKESEETDEEPGSEASSQDDTSGESENITQKPVSPDVEKSADTGSETEASPGEVSEEEASGEAREELQEIEDSPEKYYQILAEKAEGLTDLTDWAYVSMEFDNLENQWKEGPETEGLDIGKYKEKIDALRDQFEEKKRTHYEEQKRIREENLEKKRNLLKQLKEIIDEKNWTYTKEIGKIKARWEQIKSVPADEAEKLQKSFDQYIATFDEHKVDRLVKKKQQEEDNLTGKLVILEKMEQFVKDVGEKPDWAELEKKLNDLSRQFRKIGRIPVEKNQEVWGRYHQTQDTFHALRFKHDKKYREDIERFLSKKKKLIDEAEALIDFEDLAEAARVVNKLHRRWKKAGNLPQKEENELWDRFKAATDAFNDKKSENLGLLRKQEDENLAEKMKLIDKAEEIKESEDWEGTHKELQKLMNLWKNAGPVPKRKSGKIWKKFKGAMDHFYDRRRDYFKEVKEERKDNLKEKEETLQKLAELKGHNDPIKAVELAKPLQDEFKKAGYVPIKHKNRLWKEYRETCDVIYDRFRAAKDAVEIVGRDNVDNFTTDDLTDIRKKQNEVNTLRKQISKLSSELIQMKESLSYFKPSGKGSSLLDDVKARVDRAENEITQKEEKLQSLEKEIDQIKREG